MKVANNTGYRGDIDNRKMPQSDWDNVTDKD